MDREFLKYQKGRFGEPAMTNAPFEPGLSKTEPIGIWPYFMNRLAHRTGISQYWLQFFLLLAGSLTAFLASERLHRISWDSAALLFRIATVLAAVGAVVILLPSIGRRIVVSLVIVFHFAGILTAVTSVTPSPWLSTQIWTTVYRPYLYFLWLNNAYHFYSPQPGPANQLWFCIEYESDPDGTRNFRWVLVPDWDEKGHPKNPDGSLVFSGTEYTRRLSLAEYTAPVRPAPPNLPQLLQRRVSAGNMDSIPPFDPRLLPYDQQYQQPNDVSKRWIHTYVRHVAATYKHQNKPELAVQTVKFYRVLHQILEPSQVAEGLDPNNSNLFYPFYCGEFDREGNFEKRCAEVWINSDGYFQSEVHDPYLYWVIPYDYVIRHAQGANPEKSDSNIRRLPVDAPEGNETEVKQ
jgi:hypothetical protein